MRAAFAKNPQPQIAIKLPIYYNGYECLGRAYQMPAQGMTARLDIVAIQPADDLTSRSSPQTMPSRPLKDSMSRCVGIGSSCLLFAALLVCGCGEADPLGRQALSGEVTFQGKPLDQGTIVFEPVDAINGVGSGGLITSGKYEIPADQGLPPGKYIVRITSADPTAAPPPDAMPGDAPVKLAKERIPPKWNLGSDQQIEIKAEGEHVFNYTIP